MRHYMMGHHERPEHLAPMLSGTIPAQQLIQTITWTCIAPWMMRVTVFACSLADLGQPCNDQACCRDIKGSSPCLELHRVVVPLRPKCLVGISDIRFVLVAAYNGLYLTSHFHQLLGVPEDDLQQLLLQPREMILLQGDDVYGAHCYVLTHITSFLVFTNMQLRI